MRVNLTQRMIDVMILLFIALTVIIFYTWVVYEIGKSNVECATQPSIYDAVDSKGNHHKVGESHRLVFLNEKTNTIYYIGGK